MNVWNSLRATFISALHHPHLWLLQFFGNVVIAVIFALWLHIPETGLGLTAQFVIAVMLLAGALVLQGGTLNLCADLSQKQKPSLAPSFKNALKHSIPFAIPLALVYLLLYFVAGLDNYQYEFPGYLRSEFPASLRRHISEGTMDNLYVAFVAFLRWILAPGLLLPLAALGASAGFRGLLQMRAWGRSLRNLSYWIVLIAAALVTVYCNGQIMRWTLHSEGPAVTKEGIWFGIRLLVAYLLGLFSWLWICFMLARARVGPPPATAQKVAA